jgi:N-ethylmaleimide reductase
VDVTDLWSPTTVGRLKLEHRLAMAPMSRNRAQPDGSPTTADAVYFAQRASLGLLISGGTYPSEDAQGHLLLHGIYTDKHVAGWREVTRAVHDAGGHLIIQLMHAGRHAHPDNIMHGRQPVAPSAIAPGVPVFTASGMQQAPVPRALSTQEVRATVDGFRRSAARAIEAGADGVEIHAGNGLLIQQFLAESSNRRTDAYGGSLLNRTRFAIEVATAIAGEIGADRVGIRVEPKLTRNGIDEGADVDDLYRILLAELNRLDLAHLHLVHPGNEGDLTRTRASWGNALLLNRPGLARDSIAADVTAGLADVVIVGRWALANPDLVRRLQLGAPLNEPDHATFYGGDQHGYTDYPPIDERQQLKGGIGGQYSRPPSRSLSSPS